ncbi:MAG: hypothetical protein JW751_00315, partial [Polyangiaceae bacterium]|nr:hypothetical protein [Polyangiaceae bacterium]
MTTKLQSQYGLKFNPFRPDVPIEALHTTPTVDAFLRRVELGIADGGYVMITGDVGTGKSGLTIRISVNHMHVPHLEDIARRAGIVTPGGSPRQASRSARPRFELSCLPREAVDSAAWLGKFLRAYQQDDPSLIPSPPVPTYFWNGLTLDCNYAWSLPGWELIERYHDPAHVPEAP